MKNHKRNVLKGWVFRGEKGEKDKESSGERKIMQNNRGRGGKEKKRDSFDLHLSVFSFILFVKSTTITEN